MTDANRIQELEAVARRVRATCVQLACDAREGHLNGALSVTDMLVALYSSWLNYDPADPTAGDRDRILFSKGHACTALYAAMAAFDLIEAQSLVNYCKTDGPYPNHPCQHNLPQLDASSGSLGHGLGLAAGRAYAQRLRGATTRTVAVISDGECNEGSTWEAAMFAAANGLHNLVAMVDYNRVQSVGFTDPLNGHTSFADKFRAFGWEVREVDGHNMRELCETLTHTPASRERPTAIICRTTAGGGVSFMENQVLWHYRVPSEEERVAALAELDARPLYTPEAA